MSMRALNETLDELFETDDTSTEVAAGWSQGRAAYGGLAASLALAGMRKLLPDDKPLRSLMISFVGPLPEGRAVVAPRILRQGKNVTQMSAEVQHGGNVCVQAMAAFGAARDTLSVPPSAVFEGEPRDDRFSANAQNRPMPGFINNFDVLWTGGGVPMSGKKERRLGMWVKNRSDMSSYAAERIVALADMPPPAMMSYYTAPVRGSSVTWSLEFVRPAAEVAGDWFYLDYRVDAAAGGYCQQSGHVFDENGELVMLSRQCMAYFE